jgi:glycosyltransferase involved in cell wall biosynthesis
MLELAVLFHRLGPYHHARLQAAGLRCSLTSVELSLVDGTYRWANVDGARGFRRVTLFQHADADAVAPREVSRRVRDALTRADPAVVAIPGWSHPAALAALLWCLRRRRPAVMMSDSTAADATRRWHREAIKRLVLRLCNAALVAGVPQFEYVRSLGFGDGRVFCGYDTVDNLHFARGAQRVRADAPLWRRRLGLPERFFLAVSRFIAKKNLIRLLDAYAAYRQRAGANAWYLVLLGDGAFRTAIESRIAEADLAGNVVLAGFRQYDELPAWYGLASAFIHPSTIEQWGLVVNEAMASGLPVLVSNRCGCAPDLVEDGVNGFTFDPSRVEALAGLMQRVAALTDEERAAMGRAGQRIIADWGPERFADGLMQAPEAALRSPPPSPSWFDQALLWAVARRPL